MRTLTPDQEEILKSLAKVSTSYTGTVHKLLDALTSRVVALQSLLVTKGLLGEEELEDASRHIEARMVVEKALGPELRALEEEIQRLLRGEGEERDSAGGVG